LYTVNESDVSG